MVSPIANPQSFIEEEKKSEKRSKEEVFEYKDLPSTPVENGNLDLGVGARDSSMTMPKR